MSTRTWSIKMGDAAAAPSGGPRPPTLFHAVKTDDFQGMVYLYAIAARDSAISYATSMRRRRETEDPSSGENWEFVMLSFDARSCNHYHAFHAS